MTRYTTAEQADHRASRGFDTFCTSQRRISGSRSGRPTWSTGLRSLAVWQTTDQEGQAGHEAGQVWITVLAHYPLTAVAS